MANSGETISTVLDLDETTSEMPIPGERRREHRRPIELAGVCEFNDSQQRLDCKIVDITNAGARLEFASNDEVPDNFKLFILPINVILDCRLVWRHETSIGVSYTLHL
ncbi:MAG: PilZ domain-containing protein [Hyphomicrobiales bacterium]|nr:PilZ domain-containing protein [Hyphomicrobiales bacterium]